jgi:hypothetical protein
MAHRYHTRSRDQQTLRLLGAAGLLLLYLLSATPAAPALTALVARIDRAHQVFLQPTANGTEIVLHHRHAASVAHHHGFVARALTALALPASPSQRDHILQFADGGSTLRARASSLDPTPERNSATAFALAPSTSRPSHPNHFLPSGPCPPPGLDRSASGVRFTVLLI